MDNPFFSVVIPTHNRSKLLKRAVDSVLSQTFDNFEIIAVDDHSSDDTRKIAESILDPRFKYVLNQRTKGACGARNTGIFAARGDWVAFLDDDDVWYAEKLKQQHDLILNSRPSLGLVCSDYAIYKGPNKKLTVIKNRPSGWVKDKVLLGGIIGCLSSTCVRTEFLLKIDGFDETFPSCQDQDLWIRVAEIAEFASVKKTLVYMFQEKRERIGQNHRNKLYGHIMLRDKFINSVQENIRLRCRFESTIFTYSLLLKKKNVFINSIPWFIFGLIVDFPYCINNLKKSVDLFYRFKKNIIETPWV